MKVIFLDIDGVLNCRASKSRCGGFIGIDNDKVKRLRKIVEATNAKIVLTSTWRVHWERFAKEEQDEAGNYLDRKLKREGLHIIDKTDDDWHNRGSGIIQWVGSHNVDKFIILDDEEFDYVVCGIISRLVKTSYYAEDGGLRDDHVELAIDLLNTNSIDIKQETE